MPAILAVLFLAAAVLVHGAALASRSPWLGWQGLMLLGLLCLALGPVLPLPWPRRKD